MGSLEKIHRFCLAQRLISQILSWIRCKKKNIFIFFRFHPFIENKRPDHSKTYTFLKERIIYR